MTSMQSVRNLIGEAKGQLLVLMQEGDSEAGFEANIEWADVMYRAYLELKAAEDSLDQAELL